MSVKFIQSLSQRSSVSTNQLKHLGRDSTRGRHRRRPPKHSGRNFWKLESLGTFGNYFLDSTIIWLETNKETLIGDLKTYQLILVTNLAPYVIFQVKYKPNVVYVEL